MSTHRITFEAFLENAMSGKFKIIEKDGKVSFESIDDKINKVGNSISGLENKFHTFGKRVIAAAATYFAVDRLVTFGKSVVEATSKYQTFQAVLENTLGSRDLAQTAMGQITDFASRTPFQVDELIGSYVKLTNQGFQPTMRQMRSLGDLSASTGKSFDMLTEAIIDAQTGEFERLKEFGIRAQKEGDKVTFTFKEQKKAVDFNAKSIQGYILSLGNIQGVSGAMEKISKTTAGMLSNLADSADQLKKNLGDRFKKEIDGSITTAGKFVSLLNDWAKVPLSEKLGQERIQVNMLAAELINSNTPLERRNAIYAELNNIAPDVVAGINTEKIAMGLLSQQVMAYNAQMLNRIVLQKKVEESENQQKKADKSMAWAGERASNIMETISSAEELLIARGRKDDAEVIRRMMLANTDFETKATDVAKYLARSGGLTKSTGVDYVQALMLEASLLTGANKKAGESQNLANSIKEEVNAMAKAFGIDLSQTEPGGAGSIPGSGGSGSSSSFGTDAGLGSVSGDNRTVKNITINIDRLGNIERAEFTSSNQEKELGSFLDNLRSGLMAVVNDVNYVN
jgi:hypothetical protein